MHPVKKISEFKLDWLDVALTKIAVIGATLMVCKWWHGLLELEWYWYLLIWVLAAGRPFITVYKWLRTSSS